MDANAMDGTIFDRSTNEVFASFPWFNRNLDDPSVIVDDPVLRLSMETLKTSTIPSSISSESPDDQFIRGKLGLPFNPGLAGTGPMREYSYAFFILRQRLLDVALWLSKGAPPSETTHQHGQLLETHGIPRYKHLRDWPTLVREAFVWFSNPPARSSASEAPASLCVKHLRSFIARSKSREFDCIYLNIDVAALYLSHLLAGNYDLDKSNAPEELSTTLERNGLLLNGIKTPLHLALTVSPLCLLLPINFSRNLYGRPKMLQLWKALGSERPEKLRMAEMELWRALFDISSSTAVDTTDRFVAAFRAIMDRVDKPTLRDLYFFAPNSIHRLRETGPSRDIPLTQSLERAIGARREEEEEEEDGAKEREEEAEDKGQDKWEEHSPRAPGLGFPAHLPDTTHSTADSQVARRNLPSSTLSPLTPASSLGIEAELQLLNALTFSQAASTIPISPNPSPSVLFTADASSPSDVNILAAHEPPNRTETPDTSRPLAPPMASPGRSPDLSNQMELTFIDELPAGTPPAATTETSYPPTTPVVPVVPQSAPNISPPTPPLTPNPPLPKTTPSPTTPPSPMTPLTDLDDPMDAPLPVPSQGEAMDIDGTNGTNQPRPNKEPRPKAGPIISERKSLRIAEALQAKQLKPPQPSPQALSLVKPAKKNPGVKTIAKQEKAPTASIPNIRLDKSKALEYIDLAAGNIPYPDVTLTATKTRQRISANASFKLYGCGGKDDYLDYTPTFHYMENLEWFSKVMTGVQKSYHKGLPLHIIKPQQSILKIMDFATFDALLPEEIQAIFKFQHIVVTNYPCTPTKFDEQGLDFMIHPWKPITIQDLSVQIHSGDGNERHVIGVTADLLESHRSEAGKILNALDFPMPLRGRHPPETIATDRLAFTETYDDPQCAARADPFPAPKMYWGLAATKHAFHMVHIDTDGFGTKVAPQTGDKYWVLARPKAGESGIFSRTDLYIGSSFDIDDVNLELWDVEAVLLTPQTCLFMRPNTPHLVLTPEAAICHGGHFYATSTIRQTCHGILHTFIASSLLTNTEHTTASRDLLRRILAYYWKSFRTDYIDKKSPYKRMAAKYRGRVPDIFTFDGLVDIYSICNLMELGNVVHYKTYAKGDLGALERQKMIEGRVTARHICGWLKCMVELHHPDTDPSLLDLERDLFYPYLASQVSALVHYKERAVISGAEGNSHFTLKQLEAQVHGALGHDILFANSYDRSYDPKTFDWTGIPLIVKPTRVGGYWPLNKLSGETPNDKDWVKERESILIKLAQASSSGVDEANQGDDSSMGGVGAPELGTDEDTNQGNGRGMEDDQLLVMAHRRPKRTPDSAHLVHTRKKARM